MLTTEEIKARIERGLPGANAEVNDTNGGGDHFEARVISPTFAGLSMVEQHKQVYAPLQDILATGELHALALKTYTPEQWAKTNSRKSP